MKHGSPPVAPAAGQLNEFKTSKVSSVESMTASSMEYSLEEANLDYANETNSSYRRDKTSCCKTTGWDVTFILASHVISSFFDIIVKWLFAVLLRKLFVSVEEREGASDGILGTVTSPLLEALFLDAVDFDIIIIIALLSMIPVALGAAYSQSAALNLASKMARKRRMSLLDSTLNSHLQQAQNESPAIILEHISVLFEYEARTKFQRMGEKYNIGMVIIVCMVLFWELMLLALAFVVCVLFAEFFMRSYLLKEPNTRRKAYIQDVNELILDILRNADIVAMHNMNSVEKNLLQTKEFPASSLDARISHIFFLTTFVVIFIMIVMPIATMLYARSLVDAEEGFAEAVNTLFSLMAFVLLLEESHKSFNRIALTSESDTAYQIALNTVQRALRTNYKPRDGHFDDDVASDDVCVRPGSLEFYQVTVQYPQTDRPAVSNISFTIPHGATMAIVAESGGGKSTLFRAASGLLPYLGQIRFGGLRLDESTQHTIRASLGYVSQESKLFARSIRDNIWYGNASPPDNAKIWAVLEQLGLDAWVHSLRQGLDTELTSERMVSGGQAQRLQMARLLCREHVWYVLLDECMSALDPVMRAVVTRSLKDFLQDKTVLVITHSHDTVQDLCTQVLDLNKLQRGEQDAILSVPTYLASLTRLGKQRPAAPPLSAGIWGRAA